jgi:hypothetical protein
MTATPSRNLRVVIAPVAQLSAARRTTQIAKKERFSARISPFSFLVNRRSTDKPSYNQATVLPELIIIIVIITIIRTRVAYNNAYNKNKNKLTK